jgi:hypothetical protein
MKAIRSGVPVSYLLLRLNAGPARGGRQHLPAPRADGRRDQVALDRVYWTKELRETERELEAATMRTAVNAAAKKL